MTVWKSSDKVKQRNKLHCTTQSLDYLFILNIQSIVNSVAQWISLRVIGYSDGGSIPG